MISVITGEAEHTQPPTSARSAPASRWAKVGLS
jgi:hypothetical protein